jgi:hypothetical protein
MGDEKPCPGWALPPGGRGERPLGKNLRRLPRRALSCRWTECPVLRLSCPRPQTQRSRAGSLASAVGGHRHEAVPRGRRASGVDAAPGAGSGHLHDGPLHLLPHEGALDAAHLGGCVATGLCPGEQAAAASPCDWSRLDACLQGFLSYWADHPDHLREILRAWQAEGDGQGPPPWFLAQRLQLDLLLRPCRRRQTRRRGWRPAGIRS